MAIWAYSGRFAPAVQSGVLLAGARYWGGGLWLGSGRLTAALEPGVLQAPRLRWGVGGAVIQSVASQAAPDPASPWGGALSLSGLAEADGSAWSGAAVWVFADPLAAVTVAADGTFSVQGALAGQAYNLALVDPAGVRPALFLSGVVGG
ncbi:MAG: hypothetical protein EPN21_05125 [Methylococcaceae bacterium]|nr:MAG: hypothetical protein EPN21_05125 [Methylococcaceae bacterium]